MPLILMIIGAILILVGIGGVAAGAPDWLLGLALGATLVQSGAIALVGGLLLIGIALVLSTLQQLLERFDARAATLPPRPAREPKRVLIASEPSAPHPETRVPDDEVPHWTRDDLSEPREEATRPRRETAPILAAEEPVRSRRERDLAGGETARPRREGSPGPASDDYMRVRREGSPHPGQEIPPRFRRERSPAFFNDEPPRPGDVAPAQRPRRDGPPPPPPLPLPPDERRRPRRSSEPMDFPPPRFRPVEPPTSTDPMPLDAKVVRSGVIGGMAYTLYSDGSIEAELPIGTVRFGSIAELQEHVQRTGAEADAQFQEPQG